MIDYSKYKRGPEFQGWIRSPSCDKFVHQMLADRDRLLKQLIGTAACSPDPDVRHHYAEWKSIQDLTEFLTNSRKGGESELDDDE